MTFYFRVQSQSIEETKVRIRFPVKTVAPMQFSPSIVGCNVPPPAVPCVATFTQGGVTESAITCSIENLDTLLIPLPSLDAGSADIQVESLCIPNTPERQTGQFSITTSSADDILIDQNGAFGSIFVAPAFRKLFMNIIL